LPTVGYNQCWFFKTLLSTLSKHNYQAKAKILLVTDPWQKTFTL